MGQVTIASNASLSSRIDLGADKIVGIEIPATWTTANLTFQACNLLDGTYVNVYDSSGNEVTVVVGGVSRLIVDIPELACAKFLKIRSGSSAAAIPQQGDRVLTLHVK